MTARHSYHNQAWAKDHKDSRSTWWC